MKSAWLVLTWFLVASTLFLQTGCQQPVRSEPSSRPAVVRPDPAAVSGGPRITFENPVYDFGEVASERKHTGRIAFTNTGASLLMITDVRKCCGVVAELSPRELAPGERGMLTVVYASGALAGDVVRKLHVLSNDPVNPEAPVTIKARVVPRVACEPQRLSLRLKGENAGCPEIRLTSIDKQPFSIRSFTSTYNCLTADVDTSVQAVEFVLRPTANLAMLEDHSAGAIHIAVAHPECERVDIPFSVLPRFAVRPSVLLETNAKPHTPIMSDVSVRSNYGEEFEIESVSSKFGSVKVLDQQKAGNGYLFKVETLPPWPTDDKDSRVFRDVLYVSIEGGEKLAINVYVLLQGKDALEVAGSHR